MEINSIAFSIANVRTNTIINLMISGGLIDIFYFKTEPVRL